jgi:hypothetical protein
MRQITTPLFTRIAGVDVQVGSITFDADDADSDQVKISPDEQRLARQIALQHI